MAYQDRTELIKTIQDLRGGSTVLTYVTATRQGLDSQITMNVIGRVYRLLQDLDSRPGKVDLFIHSNVGDGIVPWKLVTLIREFCDEFNVIVPYRAFSAATLAALGADNIYMHPMGMLGPTDPKVMNEFNPPVQEGGPQKIGINVEDVFSYISLVKDDVKITHEDELIKAWEFLAGSGRVHPLALGNVKRFYSQSRMMATKLLELHMDKVAEAHTVKDIADNLNSKLYFHGHPINRKEAKDLGLKVQDMTPELEDAVWKLYQAYETEMKLEEPFKPDFLLRAAHPNLPVLNSQQPPNVASQDIKESVTAIESITQSFIL